jgi:hypothetical protein
MRIAALATAATLLVGCASGGNGGARGRAAARNVLIAAVVGTAAVSVAAAFRSEAREKELQEDLRDGGLSGRDYIDRDKEGQRWNRLARGSLFLSGVSLLGLGLVWERAQSDAAAEGPPISSPLDRPGGPPPPVGPPLPGVKTGR